jgi:hypothetical protein
LISPTIPRQYEQIALIAETLALLKDLTYDQTRDNNAINHSGV